MKRLLKRFAFLALLGTSTAALAQNVSINLDGLPGHASSIFDVSSTDKGVLLPRMSEAQRLAIANPAEGLLVYQNTGDRGFYVFSNGSWQALTASAGPTPDVDLPQSSVAYSNNFYTTTGSWGTIPGMSVNVTVPAGKTAMAQVLADIGVATNATGNNNHSCTDLAIIRDGALLPEAGYKRVTAGTGANSSHNNFYKNPVITGNEVLGPGTYNFQLIAVRTCTGGQTRNAILGGDNSSILQGTLKVSLEFQ